MKIISQLRDFYCFRLLNISWFVGSCPDTYIYL